MTEDPPAPRTAVLIHGLGRNTGSMLPLSWRLNHLGIATQRIGYPSTRGGLAASVAHVRQTLTGMGPVDLVGHSLGGLIAAQLLRAPEGLDIRRIVQIGSPNLGSPLAGQLGGLWPVRQLCGPMVAELSDVPRRYPPHPAIAAIAGTGGWPGIPIPRPHDGAVTVRSAWAGATHRATVQALHTLLPVSSRVAKLTAEFLTNGHMPPR
jgi:pimeloyl-ACP methyl ester carboxylesterase